MTACPLDCYDACRIVLNDSGNLKGDKTHPVTQGYLCPHLNHFTQQERIRVPMLDGEVISMEEAVKILVERLQSQKPHEVLYYRGSGNMGLMQRSVEHFFAGYKAVGTSGSLCDGAGEAGIVAGRGNNLVLSPQMIEQSEAVIVWGRNPHVSHSHLLPFLKEKTVIVIDPVQTQMAKKADLHIQIKPRCDLQLALLLSRFVMIEGSYDEEFLENRAPEYKDFYELTQSLRIKATLERIDVSLGQIGSVLSLIQGKKTVILVGTGVQKYRDGADVLRAIDAFGVLLGLFGKPGCGVSYLGNSTEGIDIPFETIQKRISKPTADFSKYPTVFVQGANPLAQMPGSDGVRSGYEAADFTVYFGLYENETSRASNLVIPAKTFLEKDDFRSSYGDYTFQEMPRIHRSEIGISEYDLTAALCREFSLPFEDESFYLDHFRSQINVVDGIGYRRNAPEIPYEEGFENGEFEFMDEIDLEVEKAEGYFLITAKYAGALNSQFSRPEGVYFHPEAGWEEGEMVVLSSAEGSVVMEAKHDERLRRDSLLIYSGTPGVNVLTPRLLSYEGESAVYQEYKIKVEKK